MPRRPSPGESLISSTSFIRPLFAKGPGVVTPRRVTGKGRPRVATRFTPGDGPIVTSETSTWHDPRMTELCPRPDRRRFVAQIAGLCRREVVHWFSFGRRPVMTGRAAPRRHARMAERRRNPRRRPVTGVAGLRRRHMGSRFARGLTTVMTRHAGARGHA